ncbi:hypothetical protein [Roseovarius autotrophicus]|uniref:hypothetical protein n=1 Tax=Roseovarius autotrophicus TaxID=2824121 RepID=UPI001FFC629B|nr:hypothetical protein [Roseovarius autotrophicus]
MPKPNLPAPTGCARIRPPPGRCRAPLSQHGRNFRDLWQGRTPPADLRDLPPLAVRAMKRVLNATAMTDLRRAMDLETEATIAGFMDPETTRRLRDF